MVMVELGNIDPKNSLIRMLEQDFEIRPTIQRKGDMEEMCNLSSGLIEKGEKIGFERGEKSGFGKGKEEEKIATVHRIFEQFGNYEMAASLADVSLDKVKEWLGYKRI